MSSNTGSSVATPPCTYCSHVDRQARPLSEWCNCHCHAMHERRENADRLAALQSEATALGVKVVAMEKTQEREAQAAEIALTDAWSTEDVLTFADQQVPWLNMAEVGTLLRYARGNRVNPFYLATALREVRAFSEATHVS